MEYQIIFFSRTYTTNTELTSLFGSSICKVKSVFTEDNIYSVPDTKGKQPDEAPKNTCPGPTIWSYPIYLEVLEFQSLPG